MHFNLNQLAILACQMAITAAAPRNDGVIHTKGLGSPSPSFTYDPRALYNFPSEISCESSATALKGLHDYHKLWLQKMLHDNAQSVSTAPRSPGQKPGELWWKFNFKVLDLAPVTVVFSESLAKDGKNVEVATYTLKKASVTVTVPNGTPDVRFCNIVW